MTPPVPPPNWKTWQENLAQRLLDPAVEPINEDPAAGGRHAAVSIILQTGMDPNVLFMVRAEREGDRWSGQVAFPGGHREAEDDSLLVTATRETMEEVGLDLSTIATPIGQLPGMQARSRNQRVPLWVTPFVFVQEQAAEPDLGPEAADAFRVPLSPLLRGDLAAEKAIPAGSLTKRYPAWRYEERVVWGMTYHIMNNLLGEIRTLGDLPSG